MNAWTALEAFEPRTFDNPLHVFGKNLPRAEANNDSPPKKAILNFDLETPSMPWHQDAGKPAKINLPRDQSIHWFIPLAFVNMRLATKRLSERYDGHGPRRERARGTSIVALLAFDQDGYPNLDGIAISSFAWACGKVLSGCLDGLHEFREREPDLAYDLYASLVAQYDKGHQVAVSQPTFVKAMKACLDLFNLDKDLLVRPGVAFRVIGEKLNPLDIINGFFLEELHAAEEDLPRLAPKSPLRRFLSGAPPKDEPLGDPLRDPGVVADLVSPAKTPLGRWPSPPPVKLVTLQQAAVNAAVERLDQGGLLAINGPPGTGKTTLLRDIVAAVVVRRAQAMAMFDDPAHDALTPVKSSHGSGTSRRLYRLHDSLRRHGLVVASANNGAVQNVSRELPQASTVDDALDLSYFRGTADRLAEGDGACWGLIAAVLGRANLRTKFVDGVWQDAKWGLQKYFELCGHPRSKHDQERPIIQAEKPPQSKDIAKIRWKQARQAFRTAIARSDAFARLEQALADRTAADTAYQDAVHEQATSHNRYKMQESLVQHDLRTLDEIQKQKPRFWACSRQHWADWRLRHDTSVTEYEKSVVQLKRLSTQLDDLTANSERARLALDNAEERIRLIEEEIAELYKNAMPPPRVAQVPYDDMAFRRRSEASRQMASPWDEPRWREARNATFKAAMELHRAFIDVTADRLQPNLHSIMNHLKGRSISSDAADMLGDLWDTLFLLVPLVSTTFASVGRLFARLEPGTIGWLIVDEAGQSTPQSAVGALLRSKRAVIIGDPLQIEPVVTIPEGLKRAICAHYAVHHDYWAAPNASVQTVADRASPFQSTIGGDRRVGMPLLVHRRCASPMFEIANEIAYDGLMVQAGGDATSKLKDALRPLVERSCWIDVDDRARKWSRSEGDVVVALLRRLEAQGHHHPDLFCITPFKDVAARLRRHLQRSGVLRPEPEQPAWVAGRIGTIHTFQGKEADVVFLVLGASAEASVGARNWAGQTPNILNVAATRARKLLVVIGNYDAWCTAGHFETAARELPRVSSDQLMAHGSSQVRAT